MIFHREMTASSTPNDQQQTESERSERTINKLIMLRNYVVTRFGRYRHPDDVWVDEILGPSTVLKGILLQAFQQFRTTRASVGHTFF
jgi:hypothetical protein